MAVLEEFKKQLVEDLPRYMIEDNLPRDQMWKQLKNEYGWDCKLLWERIGLLITKKLSKMLTVDDRTESIPNVAKMTPNDWLIFDKILVHENIDVIGEKLMLKGHPEPKVLWELYILVSSYHIETLPREDVAMGWYSLTKTYNSSGRYCSAMLLQRRWYQLKQLVRKNFHSFWSLYEGHRKYMKYVPRVTNLQKIIAKRYSKILTGPFIPWQDLVKKKLVAQVNDIEKCSDLGRSETSNNDQDVFEIKPTIETIDVNKDSESDDSKNKSSQVRTDKENQSGINDVQLQAVKIYINDLNYEDDKDTSKTIPSTIVPKIISGDKNNSAQNIDPKLLMIPICYTKKLDHMSVFKNKNYLKIKGNDFIKRIEAENKPMIMKCIKEAITNDISRITTPKIRQYPKKRMYILKKLKTNPDFNVQLKKLPVRFFLNEQNRRSLFNCKAVTVDIDELIENKVHNSNPNLEDINSQIKQVKESSQCVNTTSVVPSADNREIIKKIKKSLPQLIKINKSDTTINNTGGDRCGGKRNMAMEVSPLCTNNSTSKPPLKLVQYEKDTRNHNNSTTLTTKKIVDCANTSSDSLLTKKSLIKANVIKVKEFLPKQNEPEKCFNENRYGDLKEHMPTEEIDPLSFNAGISKTKSLLKSAHCPIDTFKNDKKSSETNLGANVKTNNLPVIEKLPKPNSSVAQQTAELLLTKRIIKKNLKEMLNIKMVDKETQTSEHRPIIVSNNTLVEDIKLVNVQSSEKSNTTQASKSNKQLQSKMCLYLENVPNNERSCKEKTVTKSQDKSISGKSKNCHQVQNVQKHYDIRKLIHVCTEPACKCADNDTNVPTSTDTHNDLTVENSITSLPIQNPVINLQCESNQNSHYLIVSPLHSNTKVNQVSAINERSKNVPLPSPLIVTRVSSESPHSTTPHMVVQPIPITGYLCTCNSLDEDEQNYQNVNDQLDTTDSTNSYNEMKVLNANWDLNSRDSSLSPDSIDFNNSVLPSHGNNEVIGRIETKNGNIQIIPHNVKKETINIRKKRKVVIDFTEYCESKEVKRKAIIYV